MSVKILTGAIGSGKTKYCIDKIAEVHSRFPDRRCIMLVPPHYSHITEQLLINKFGGTGLNNIECTSFEKLARELLPDTDTIGVSGKNVLICRATALTLEEIKDRDFDRRLIRAIAKTGFIDIAASLVGELHHYNITSEDIISYSKATDNPILSQKLEILSIIADKYTALLENTGYIDADYDLVRLSHILPDNFCSDDFIWIDKFDEFLPQQLDVLYALINSGADITVTFNLCPDNSNTYYGTKTAIRDICEYCKPELFHLDGQMRHINAPDLKFLFSEWHNRKVYTDRCTNAEIFAARDAYTETEHTARKILDLVREDGYRFSQIGILCSSREKYSHIIEAVFDEYEIPYYTDTKISISEYPIAMQILALFDVIDHNWNYSSMFEYLRAGFVYTNENGRYIRLDSDKLDILENHVLKYGIEYKSAWTRSWLTPTADILETAFSKEPKDSGVSEMLEDIRIEVITPILSYNERARSAETVSDYCKALFEFLEDINLYQGLKAELLQMSKEDATSDVQRFSQIWNLILGVLDEINSALGTEKATHSEFCQYVKAAMSQCQIRTVPSGIDRVYVGLADTNRAVPTPVMFVMGAVAGTYPSISSHEGFLSNSEREALSQSKLQLAPTTLKKAEKQTNMVYKLLSAVMDKLYISYPSMTSEGASTLPSQTVKDIIAKLPQIRITDDVTENSDMLYISSPKATMHKFLMSRSDNPLWEYVEEWFGEHNEWSSRLFTVNSGKYSMAHRRIELSPDTAQALYEGKNRYSATRLNAYASCPFSHFMKYGLGAYERDIYEIKATETGSYAHGIIEMFCKRVDNDDTLSWNDIDDKKCADIVDELVTDTINGIKQSDLRDKEMSMDILLRMGNTVKEAAKTVCRSIRCGEFEISDYEKEVSVKLTDNIELGGIIDRLDVCRHDGTNEYRIIDYKTGSKDFSPADIYNGIDMQPVIYALAMRMLDNKATVSGLYYGLVHNDFARADITTKKETIENALKNNTQYNGVTFIGNDINSPLPEDEVNRIESEYSRNNGSMFFGSKGKAAYGKSIRPRPDSEWLMERVKDNIVEFDRSIRNGNIDISPVTRNNNGVCTFCEYKSVCKFDEEYKTERNITEKDSDIWTMIEEGK